MSERSGHLGRVTPANKLSFPHIKFGLDWLSDFRAEDV